ncbi:phosphoribosylanthranilate isomerase [Mangrovitalea sediminis]|uniref:phosphoribosylanthranilate isomerase n=1 Tax=Mangrovitalea sediminis TaxID=1982043 RepID=UPI000BE5A001|nr:phosphoribosylanthranilate isomerase [Mangrovitalea sediminis]
MTRIKICGITRQEDAQAAVDAGADAIGFVFYAPSPRAIAIDRAWDIVRGLPPFVSSVGLFVNAEPDWVREVLATVPLDLLQFHGDETPDYCSQFGRPWMKAIRVRSSNDIERAFSVFAEARGLLVDAFDPALYGGTGRAFDWSLIPRQRPLPLVLAGGLDSVNVADAIRQVRPWAVDVSGGVESAKGIKSAEKIRAFINEVRSVGKTD